MAHSGSRERSMALAQRSSELFFECAAPRFPALASIRHFTSAPRPAVPSAANDARGSKPPRLDKAPLVLVVDDDPEHCAYMAEVLARRGCRVAMTLSGRDALRRLESEAFDAVVTDVYMPDLDGIELVRELRRRRPGLCVIAVTGGGMGLPASVPNFLKYLGVSAILAKPFEPRDLTQAVENAVRGSDR